MKCHCGSDLVLRVQRRYQGTERLRRNPEERLNAGLKQEIGKRVPVKTKAKLRDAANEHMMMLEQNPQRVMSYFQDRRVRYAA